MNILSVTNICLILLSLSVVFVTSVFKVRKLPKYKVPLLIITALDLLVLVLGIKFGLGKTVIVSLIICIVYQLILCFQNFIYLIVTFISLFICIVLSILGHNTWSERFGFITIFGLFIFTVKSLFYEKNN